MNRLTLFSTTVMIALAANASLGGPYPQPASRSAAHSPSSRGVTLYSQNSNYGYSIISQNFTSGSMTSYDSAAADDFIVPRGKTWKVTGVDVAGQYFYGTGPAKSEVVTFYKNDNGHPGQVIGHPQKLKCKDDAGAFACTINTVTLIGGKGGKRYWLSVVANCDYNKCGEWGWVQNTATQNDPGQWENPGGGFGFGCASWNNTSTCMTQSGVVDDYAFDLRGKSN